MKLQRHPANPILLPDPASDWECDNVFNPSVIHHNGLFHMHYRAQGLDWVSRIGYAVSADGVHWNRLRRPVLAPHDGSDSRGVEDPHVTELDGVFYMAYTAYGREFSGTGEPTHAGGGILPMIARSENLITWERLGPIVRGGGQQGSRPLPAQDPGTLRGAASALAERLDRLFRGLADLARGGHGADLRAAGRR